MRFAPLLALSLLAATLAVAAAPTAAASTCAPDEVAQMVCAVVAIPVNAVNYACQKQFDHDCLTFG